MELLANVAHQEQQSLGYALAANRMIQNRVVGGTRRGYESKIKIFTTWLQEKGFNDALTEDGKLKIPLDVNVVLPFFGFIGDGGLYRGDDGTLLDANGQVVTEQAQGKRTKAVSTIGGYRSALVWYYKEQKLKMSSELEIALSNYISGFKRNVADLKQRGLMDIQEGRAPIAFSGYSIVCRAILTHEPIGRSASWQKSIFAWPFFVFCWNLMARSCSVGDMMLQHLRWHGDALVCTLPKHKGDQVGDKIVDRHVFANPLNPSICPILSLGLLLFCKPFREEGGQQQVFEGNRSECRFSEILRGILDSLPEASQLLLGASTDDIGTHSPRKGSTTFVLGMIGGPTPVQVFLRAGWSLGNVKDRYLFSGEGGDQLSGRCVAGLPITDGEFATLPPHFSESILITIEEHNWATIIPGSTPYFKLIQIKILILAYALQGYENYPHSFKTTMPFLLASVVYHQDWLRSTLSPSHPLFLSRLFTDGHAQRLKSHVLLGVGVCKKTGLTATGVPHHLVISHNLLELQHEMRAEMTSMKRKFEDLEANVHLRLDELPQKVTDTLRSSFEISGAIAVTRQDIQNIFDALRQEIRDSRSISSGNPSPVEASPPNSTSVGEFSTFHWNGQLHMVPAGFRFPLTVNLKVIWDLWFYGNKDMRIQPYRFIKAASDLEIKSDRAAFSKAKFVINRVIQNAQQSNLVGTGVNSICQLPKVSGDEVFNKAFVNCMQAILNNGDMEKSRIGELSYIRVYDILNKKT